MRYTLEQTSAAKEIIIYPESKPLCEHEMMTVSKARELLHAWRERHRVKGGYLFESLALLREEDLVAVVLKF